MRKLVSFQEALRRLREAIPAEPVGVAKVRLEEALWRVLAEDIVAHLDVPGFRRATMDGYAVRAEDTYGADVDKPAILKLVGRVEMGEPASHRLRPGECVEIATGAMMPEGANAVVRAEATERRGRDVLVFEAVAPGQNVMERGADIKAGEKALCSGELLTPAKLGVLSALGLREVVVFKKPKVAVISTGVELVRPGEELGPGKIYDINWITMMAAVRMAFGEPLFLGIARDELYELKDHLSEGLERADAVIATGASSIGASDLMREALQALGARLLVDGIRCKPGKPTIIALHGRKPVFCLPGNPTSALTMFMVFVEPVLARMAGLREIRRPFVKARLASRILPDTGRYNFVPVSLSRGANGSLLAMPIAKGSGAITSLSSAHGFVEVPEGTPLVEEGSEVLVRLFWPAWPMGRFELEAPID